MSKLSPLVSPDELLDEVQEHVEHLQVLFYEWACWLRQHRSSISCGMHCDQHDSSDYWNMSCKVCGASPESINSEYRCLGCGGARCWFRSLKISGIPQAKAECIEALHEEFMKILAGLGIVFERLDVGSASFFEAFSINALGNVRAPRLIPKSCRPTDFAPRSLLRRLSDRSRDISKARERGKKIKANSMTAFEISQHDYCLRRLQVLKSQHGISDDTHVLVGPQDSRTEFVIEPVQGHTLDTLSWPLTYKYWERSSEDIEALDPCGICGRIFFSEEELNTHKDCAHGTWSRCFEPSAAAGS
eukprot:TRINITY_DN24294_c1_g2_i1.p1 TRINITY_DN24294_c1_g2~~TRINITY_DN24294_c1_g2_i1.p1  ORF type:complete len:302 (+),score=31.39 TRINITY_DN24294_c1_g2_i1:409-1314(+)